MNPRRRHAKTVTERELCVSGTTLAVLTGLLGLIGSFLGPLPVGTRAPKQAWLVAVTTDPIWRARISRLTAAGVVGASLSVAGVGIQGLLRNPLAEPYVLGIASGAGVGVRLWLLVGSLWFRASWSRWLPHSAPGPAFLGAVVTCLIVYRIARRGGRADGFSLILSGVILNTFHYALMLLLSLFADPFRIDEFSRWSMGEIPDWIAPPLLGACAAAMAGGWIYLLLQGAAFNVLSLGDDVAQSSGVSVPRLRLGTFAVVGLMTSAAVALAGPVSFVGLIVPHLCRLAIGSDHRRLVLYSGFSGACLVMTADLVCRRLGPSLGVGKLPVGLVMAMSGAPLFLALMHRRGSSDGPP